MAPASTNYSRPDGSVSDRLLRHYQERAQGGIGLVIVEFTYIDNEASKTHPAQLGIYDDQLIPGLALLARVIQENGAKAAIQIVHAGLLRVLPIPPILGPSSVSKGYVKDGSGIVPTELTDAQIQSIILSFGKAAVRAKRAGFDLVELHGAHGYLMNQFLSPYTNRRKDRYGGSLEARMRFPLEVCRHVRQSVGKDYPLGIRINGTDFLEGGVTLEEARIFAGKLEEEGLNVIHVSAGVNRLRVIEPMLLPAGAKVEFAHAIKSSVRIPVIASGSITTPEMAEEIISQKKADFISMARPLFADPDFPKKALSGRGKEIRPCIRCNEGCLLRGTSIFQPVKCTVNVAVGFEEWLDRTPAPESKKVLVIGGGPAGMEAALTAAQKGHKVTLIEKTPSLGGKLKEASFPDFKKDLARLIDYYVLQLQKWGIEVLLGQEAGKEDVLGKGYQAVILATGSDLLNLQIPGMSGENVRSCLDVLRGEEVKETEVVVMGGGLAGCEVALFLAQCGKRVNIVEMLEEIGTGVDSLSMEILIEKFKEYQVRCFVGQKVIEARKDGVMTINRKGGKIFVPGQRIIVATGFAPNDKLLEEISASGIDICTVGDCVEPRKIYEAIHEGNRAARSI